MIVESKKDILYLLKTDIPAFNKFRSDTDNIHINLEGVDLKTAYLAGCDLTNCNLTNSNLEEANLEDADLSGSDLTDSNLRNANLEDTEFSNSNLTRANLRGAKLINTDLFCTNLAYTQINYELEEGLLKKIYLHILDNPNSLDMSFWNSYANGRCIAGLAVELLPEGDILADIYGIEIAGLLLLGEEAHRYFYQNNKIVMRWLETKFN